MPAPSSLGGGGHEGHLSNLISWEKILSGGQIHAGSYIWEHCSYVPVIIL